MTIALVPVDVADRMVALARREALWRGILIGFSVAFFLSWLLLPAGVRAQVIPEEAHRWQREIMRAGQSVWGLNAPTATFAAQIHQESRYRVNAASPVGAKGIAQFMPSTAQWIASEYPSELSGDPATPEWGIAALVRYNRHLWNRIKGADDCERMAFVLSSYNGGEGWMIKRKRLSPDPLVCLFSTCEINPGITPANQRENAGYPKRILITLEQLYVQAGFGPGACAR